MLITEEVLSSEIAMWYSPDGRYLAYASFNDTQVKDITFPHYGAPGSLEDQYPTNVKIKYPKVPKASLNLHIQYKFTKNENNYF